MADRPIYSALLIDEVGLTGTAEFDVPPGVAVVVHCVTAYMGSQLTEAGGSLRSPSGAKAYTFSTPALEGSYDTFNGKVVYPGPCTLKVVMDGGNADVTVSGWYLSQS